MSAPWQNLQPSAGGRALRSIRLHERPLGCELVGLVERGAMVLQIGCGRSRVVGVAVAMRSRWP